MKQIGFCHDASIIADGTGLFAFRQAVPYSTETLLLFTSSFAWRTRCWMAGFEL